MTERRSLASKIPTSSGKSFLGRLEGFPQDINASRIVFVDDGEIAAPKPDAIKLLPARE